MYTKHIERIEYGFKLTASRVTVGRRQAYAGSDKGDVVIERAAGLDFYLDPSLIDAKEADRIRAILADALAALDRRLQKPEA